MCCCISKVQKWAGPGAHRKAWDTPVAHEPLQLWPRPSGTFCSTSVWDCLPASNQQQGPAFQRGSEGTWALKQSLLSLGLRAPRDLTAVLGGPPHLQGVILQKKMEIGNLRSLILVTCYWMLWTWAWPFSPSPSYSLEFPHLLLVFKISILRQEVYRLQMQEAGHTGYLMWLFHL